MVFERKVQTVIIPYFSDLDKLKRALVSLENQTIKPDNVILINDAGNEALSNGEIKKFKLNIYHLINAVNLGPGLSRQRGLDFIKDNLSTEFVNFLDSDDFLSDNFFEDSLDTFKENDGIIATYCRIKQVGKTKLTIDENPVSEVKSLLFGVVGQRPWGTGSLNWRYSSIKKIQWQNLRRGEDRQFELDVARHGKDKIQQCKRAWLYVDWDYTQENIIKRNKLMGTEGKIELELSLISQVLNSFSTVFICRKIGVNGFRYALNRFNKYSLQKSILNISKQFQLFRLNTYIVLLYLLLKRV